MRRPNMMELVRFEPSARRTSATNTHAARPHKASAPSSISAAVWVSAAIQPSRSVAWNSNIGQHPNMSLHTATECAQAIATFQTRDNASLALASRHVFQAMRDPDVVLLDQAQLAHVVLPVRIETGADENHLGPESLQPRHPGALDQFPDLHALGVGRYRQIDQVGSAGGRSE